MVAIPTLKFKKNIKFYSQISAIERNLIMHLLVSSLLNGFYTFHSPQLLLKNPSPYFWTADTSVDGSKKLVDDHFPWKLAWPTLTQKRGCTFQHLQNTSDSKLTVEIFCGPIYTIYVNTSKTEKKIGIRCCWHAMAERRAVAMRSHNR